MCIVFKKELDELLDALTYFVYFNEGISDEVEYKDQMKDYLARLKEANKLSVCGCEGVFEIKKENELVLVFIQITGLMYKFIIDKFPRYEKSSFSEAIPNYDEITENNGDDYELTIN